MRHARPGRTSLPVPRLRLGVMTFGLPCDARTDHVDLHRRGDDPR